LQNRRFTLEVELTVYRLVQELMAGFARQQATQLTIQAKYEKRILQLTIQATIPSALLDAAFKEAQAITAGVRQRLSYLHGTLHLQKQEDGLTIAMEIPAESQPNR